MNGASCLLNVGRVVFCMWGELSWGEFSLGRVVLGRVVFGASCPDPSLAFQIPSASKDVYMYSFFPQTIRDWNDLPESLISSSELSDDSVSKFTSLVRARD